MESPPIRHWETGKAGEDEEAEPEELPDWNAVSSLRETGRRDETCISYAFLPRSKKAFSFVVTVTIRRFSSDLPMALPETKCGCVRIRTLFPKMYSHICDLCVIRRPME